MTHFILLGICMAMFVVATIVNEKETEENREVIEKQTIEKFEWEPPSFGTNPEERV